MTARPTWYLYLVRCRDGSLYTGITTDVARRFAEHQANAGAKYLRGRGPLRLALQKKVGNRRLALSVESRIKKLSKGRKEEMLTAKARLNELIKRARSASPP